QTPKIHSPLCAYIAFALVSGVRLKFLISATSAAFSGESWAKGGGGRNRLAGVSTQVFHVPANGMTGLVPVHRPRSVGTAPVQRVSKPSAFARAITCSATARPSSSPALASLG